nr:uncharacterized protein BN887_04201 [Melanopsichium pennsylvanicum 4]
MLQLRSDAPEHITSQIMVWRLVENLKQYEEFSLFPEIQHVYRDLCQRNKKEIEEQLDNYEEILES